MESRQIVKPCPWFRACRGPCRCAWVRVCQWLRSSSGLAMGLGSGFASGFDHHPALPWAWVPGLPWAWSMALPVRRSRFRPCRGLGSLALPVNSITIRPDCSPRGRLLSAWLHGATPDHEALPIVPGLPWAWSMALPWAWAWVTGFAGELDHHPARLKPKG